MGRRARATFALVVLLCATVLVGPGRAMPRTFDVAAENLLPGTDHWQLSRRAFDERTLAFADRASVLPGDTFGLYVQCRGTFSVKALRIGDYGGLGARRIWSSDEQRCERQVAASVDSSTNTATAPWRRSLEVTTADWPEGMYVLKVLASDGSGTYVDLVVRSESADGRVLMVSSTQTFQAYNRWGGANAYRGKGGYSARARIVSYDRPQTWGSGSGKFLAYEAPLLQRAERLGLPLAFAADVDITADPTLVQGASSIVFGGHAEYWTQAQRDAVMRARSAGTNLLFFGANTAYWRVRLSDSPLGPQRVMAVYKSRSSDPNTQRPSIRFRDSGQPDAELTGVTYSCFPAYGAFIVTDASSWVFAGTGVREGDSFAGIVGPEVDKLQQHTLADQVLASSKAKCGTHTTHSTMLLRQDRSGAVTFAVGTMGWVSKVLRGEGPAPSLRLVREVTDNVLRATVQRGLGNA